jgi:hypothetical protein
MNTLINIIDIVLNLMIENIVLSFINSLTTHILIYTYIIDELLVLMMLSSFDIPIEFSSMLLSKP